jgi:thiol-disulfide isomerase/thioredoxin
LTLGQAYERTARPDAAIDAYARSLGTFGESDTSAATPLRTLYRKRHGSLQGMDELLAAARRASREKEALASRRDERPAPDWTLPDLDDKPVQFADFKGKVVVMDFWGSWCGPCRTELPHYQALYDRYKNSHDVAFISLNWEHAETAEKHQQTALKFMTLSHYTFPVVYDHDGSAVKNYGIQGFPTVFLIDRTGKIRYKNVGFSEQISEILEAQIQSLLE